MAINYGAHLGGESQPQQSAKAKKGKFSISVTKKEGGQQPVIVQDQQGELPPVITSKPPATITVGGGRTFNLGNYNSAKVEVSLSYPVDVDDLEAGWEFAYGWVEKKMEALIAEAGLESK